MQFPYITGKAFYFRIVIELALPFYLFLILSKTSLRPRIKNWLNLAVGVFFLANLVSSFFGANPTRSLWGNFERMGGTFYLLHLVLLYFYVQLLGQAGGVYLKRFLQAFVGVATLVTLNGLSGWVHGPTFSTDLSLPDRVSSTFGNPIFFASYLIVPLFLAIYFAFSEDHKVWKILFSIMAVLQLIGIYSSGTRGALVGLVVAILAGGMTYISLNKSLKSRKYVGLILCTILVILGLFFTFQSKLSTGGSFSRLVNFHDNNTKARLIQWKMALQGFKDRPVFGVGSENYYVIANQYYNPEIVKYDSSWFDKPHNYLLEILVTNGIFGLLTYLGMFILALYGLWKAYKAELIGLFEMCLLLSAIIAYQVQNLTVFDTVSASVAFYIALGLVAYMWTESVKSLSVEKKETTENSNDLKIWLFIIGSVIMLYVIYVSNFNSMQVAKRINFGTSYSDYDLQKAADYFQSALAVPYNLDPRETANRYSDFVAKIAGSDLATTKPDFVLEQMNKATSYQRAITEKTKNDPILYLRLAVDEINLAQFQKQGAGASLETVDKAIALAPKRSEVYQVKLQIVGNQKDWANAVSLGEKIVEYNPYSLEFRWQLVMLLYLNDQIDKAVKLADETVAAGYKFTKLQQFSWYIQYYEKQKDYTKTAPLLEKAIELEPNEIGLYVDLAQTYAKLGDYSHARALAKQVAVTDPSLKKQMEEFIKTLK
jgi:O-antigen ligase/Tfp pilus assembly protein PilF